MRGLLAAGLSLCAVLVVVAADPPPAAENIPLAIVNLQKVMFESVPGKAVIQELDDYVAKKQKELTAKQEEVTKLQTELKEKDKDLKPEQKQALAAKIAALEAEAAKLRAEAQRSIQKIQRNAVGQLQAEADRLLKEYAKEKGIQLVYDSSEEAHSKFIVINANADITDELLKRMEKFKVKPPEEDKPDPADTDPKPQVKLETSLGDIVVELDRAKAPITVANFLKYVDAKHYDGTIFHRVMKDFMIQGGGYTDKLDEKPSREAIVNEAKNGLKNVRGAIAMARTDDPDSASAQFFINTVDNPDLDHKNDAAYGYAVFGKVIKGMDVVDKIREVKTGMVKGMKNVPLETVTIKSAKRVPKPAEKP